MKLSKKYSEEQVEWSKEYARNVFDKAQCADFQKWSKTNCATVQDILDLPNGDQILAEFYDPAYQAE